MAGPRSPGVKDIRVSGITDRVRQEGHGGRPGRAGRTTVTFHRDGQTVVANDVPADVCGKCGEACVTEDVAEQLLEMAAEARKAHAQVLVRPFAPAA